jgi:predicted DNA-binding transcriptional regulator YafY
LRRAIGDERWVRLGYVDAQGAETDRVVVPLALYFWGQRWLLAAYCWLRGAYRSFRVDRVRSCADLNPDERRIAELAAPISLDAYILAMETQYQAEMRGVGQVRGSEAP